MKKMRLILASASPRRAELLHAAGFDFTVQVSPLKEPARKPAGLPVDIWPVSLAYLKAAAVADELRHHKQKSGTLILGADTIVVLDTDRGAQIINKPADRAHARRILQRLAGKKHRVITGICIVSPAGRRLAAAEAFCKMQRLSPRRLEAYLDSNLWRGKAGAYGIQNQHPPHASFVTLLEGDITTVIGLPMPLVKRELARMMENCP